MSSPRSPPSARPSHADVSAQLAHLPPEALQDAAEETDARPLAYPLGSAEAEEAALAAGLKPVVRQAIEPEEVAATRERLEGLGLHVVDVSPNQDLAVGRSVCRLVLAGRDRQRVEAAAGCERDAVEGHERELGALLGYPACCLEAFLAASGPRTNAQLARRALGATRGACAPRLNMLDLKVFHYLSWQPCSFDCEPSQAYADAVADVLRHAHGQPAVDGTRCPPGCRHERFVEDVDAALAAHRLWLADDVQVSLEGPLVGGAVEMERVWPTARDRHPDAPLPAEARDAVARVLAALRGGRRLEVREGAVLVDGRRVLRVAGATLYPFGSPDPVPEALRAAHVPTPTAREEAQDGSAGPLAARLVAREVRSHLVRDLARVLEAEVSRSRGPLALPYKVAFEVARKARRDFLAQAVDALLDEWVEALERPYAAWREGGREGRFSRQLIADGREVSDALLAVAEGHADRLLQGPVLRLHQAFRPLARARIQAALPRVGWLLDRYVRD